jgi:hypothetical protein
LPFFTLKEEVRRLEMEDVPRIRQTASLLIRNKDTVFVRVRKKAERISWTDPFFIKTKTPITRTFPLKWLDQNLFHPA